MATETYSQQLAEAPAPEYALGHSEHELKRLSAQAKLFDPFTHRMFSHAGLTQGMRVLDVGSGSGDVAFLAAWFVGESGEVVGVDRAPAAVDAANARAQTAGLTNVKFRAGDVATISFDRPFDAVVGRLVLMYQKDPVAVLRHLASQLRPGGIIAFQECDIESAKNYPEGPVIAQLRKWIGPALARTGADGQMGLKLYSSFIAAGLPEPSMSLEALIGGGSNAQGPVHLPEVVRSLLPVIERYGIATAEEVQIESLKERFEAEILALGAITVSASFIGAWTKLSS
jgi:SAM-dependent methyltransferase